MVRKGTSQLCMRFRHKGGGEKMLVVGYIHFCYFKQKPVATEYLHFPISFPFYVSSHFFYLTCFEFMTIEMWTTLSLEEPRTHVFTKQTLYVPIANNKYVYPPNTLYKHHYHHTHNNYINIVITSDNSIDSL